MTLPHPKHFTNQTDALQAYKDLWARSRNQRILNIEGLSGNGKSTLLWYLYTHYDKTDRLRISINLEHETLRTDDHALLDLLARQFYPHLPQGALDPYYALCDEVDEEAMKIRYLGGPMIITQMAMTGGYIDSSSISINAEINQRLEDHKKQARKKLTHELLKCIEPLAQSELVLFIDTYEVVHQKADRSFRIWLEEILLGEVLRVLPYLRIVIAGREDLPFDPSQHTKHKLHMWKRADSDFFLTSYDLTDPIIQQSIFNYCKGHPLLTNLAREVWTAGQSIRSPLTAEMLQHDIDSEAASQWLFTRLLERVREPLRSAIRVAALLRRLTLDVVNTLLSPEMVLSFDEFQELLHYSFIQRLPGQPLQVHPLIRRTEDAWSREHEQVRYVALHSKATNYYEEQLESAVDEQNKQYLLLELLYHRVCSDEKIGIDLFQDTAEKWASYKMLSQLRLLLNDMMVLINNFQLSSSYLWVMYYNTRLAHLEGNFTQAEQGYHNISKRIDSPLKLQAYALCDWGKILMMSYYQDNQAISALERSLALVPIDSKLASNLFQLSSLFQRRGELEKSAIILERARDFYYQQQDYYGLVSTLNRLKSHYLYHGNILQGIEYNNRILDSITHLNPYPPSLRMEILADGAVFWAWYGFLYQTEYNLREARNIELQLSSISIGTENTDFMNALGYVLGMQGKYQEAIHYFNQCISVSTKLAKTEKAIKAIKGITIGFRGHILRKQGVLQEAEQELRQSLAYKRDLHDFAGIPEICIWLGEVFEIRARQAIGEERTMYLTTAETFYHEALSLRWTKRIFFECSALTGLVRVNYARGNYSIIPGLFKNAEQLAQWYEYNDLLASLRLIQGHLAWDGYDIDPTNDSSFEIAQSYYKQALVYALRYNRYLLDEVLSGERTKTPLPTLISHCLERGTEGKDMLSNLYLWWKEGKNYIDISRPDTISRLKEGDLLVHCEYLAREYELGDGSKQKLVLDQINTPLGS